MPEAPAFRLGSGSLGLSAGRHDLEVGLHRFANWLMEIADRACWYISDQLGHSRKYISSQYLGARR